MEGSAAALPLRRTLLPWATPHAPTAASGPRQIAEIAGGDWQRGKKVFFSEQAACFKCHQVGGEGGKIGPDLSNLIYRDYVSVLRDITEPSAALNPDHIAYQLELKDGNSVTGVIVGDTGRNHVAGTGHGRDSDDREKQDHVPQALKRLIRCRKGYCGGCPRSSKRIS